VKGGDPELAATEWKQLLYTEGNTKPGELLCVSLSFFFCSLIHFFPFPFPSALGISLTLDSSSSFPLSVPSEKIAVFFPFLCSFLFYFLFFSSVISFPDRGRSSYWRS
jgi:hypothetical protein